MSEAIDILASIDGLPRKARNNKIRQHLPEMIRQYMDENNLHCAWIMTSEIGGYFGLARKGGQNITIHNYLKRLVGKPDYTLPIIVKEIKEVKSSKWSSKRYHFLIERIGATITNE